MAQNLNYNNSSGISQQHLSDRLAELVGNTRADFVNSKCISIGAICLLPLCLSTVVSLEINMSGDYTAGARIYTQVDLSKDADEGADDDNDRVVAPFYTVWKMVNWRLEVGEQSASRGRPTAPVDQKGDGVEEHASGARLHAPERHTQAEAQVLANQDLPGQFTQSVYTSDLRGLLLMLFRMFALEDLYYAPESVSESLKSNGSLKRPMSTC